MDTITTRRGILGAMALAPLAVSIPAIAATHATTPFQVAAARYRLATARFNDLPDNLEDADLAAFRHEEIAYHDAVDAVDRAPCADWHEFAEAFEIACDNGNSLPNEDLVYKLLDDVRRLKRRG